MMQQLALRIIPALAGNTLSWGPLLDPGWDHPRSRGEYVKRPWVPPPPKGSSPLSRGIPGLVLRGGQRIRIIPALAGNTISGAGGLGACWDHPRSRGEYPVSIHGGQLINGSSPLSRGILCLLADQGRGPGIIPALAGNTHHRRMGRRDTWDHPRSRGEYINWWQQNGYGSGSSPLSRGIHGRAHPLWVPLRIIPALAGNTGTPGTSPSGTRDHPRSRGEYTVARIRYGCLWGSSPLSRGIRWSCNRIFRPSGIIPALAGNTPPPPTVGCSLEDHPRSRGEYDRPCLLLGARHGSSPLSRGIHTEEHCGAICRGIIPALAGNTQVQR